MNQNTVKAKMDPKGKEGKSCSIKQTHSKWSIAERCVISVVTVGALVIAIISMINSAKCEEKLRKEFDLKLARIVQEFKSQVERTAAVENLHKVLNGRFS